MTTWIENTMFHYQVSQTHNFFDVSADRFLDFFSKIVFVWIPIPSINSSGRIFGNLLEVDYKATWCMRNIIAAVSDCARKSVVFPLFIDERQVIPDNVFTSIIFQVHARSIFFVQRISSAVMSNSFRNCHKNRITVRNRFYFLQEDKRSFCACMRLEFFSRQVNNCSNLDFTK